MAAADDTLYVTKISLKLLNPYLVSIFADCFLGFCRLAEPITLSSMFPYSYYMIKSFNVPKADIGYWAGIMAASFSFSQMLTAILWGYLSDKIGRKPAILLGLVGAMLRYVVMMSLLREQINDSTDIVLYHLDSQEAYL